MRLLPAFALILALSSTGCLAPPVEGPQIDDIPDGFAFDPNCEVSRSLIAGKRPIGQRCYINDPRGDKPDWITISEYSELLSREDIEASYKAYVETYLRCVPDSGACETAGELETLVVDGYEGAGYSVSSLYRGEERASYQLILPHGDRTYTVRVSGRKGKHAGLPWAKAMARSFAVRHASDLVPLQIAAALAMAALFAGAFFWMRRQRQVETPEELAARQGPLAFSENPGAPRVAPPVLTDAAARVGGLRRGFSSNPQGTVIELERLRDAFAPNPQVLQLLCQAYLRVGAVDKAVAELQRAWPVLLAADQLRPAAQLYLELGQAAFSVGLDRDQELLVAETLLAQGSWEMPSHIFGRLLAADPYDKKAAAGLIRIAENRLRVPGGRAQAGQLYSFLTKNCKDSVLQRRAADAGGRLMGSV